MEYFNDFIPPINTTETTYYSLRDLHNFLFGAPLWKNGDGSLNRLDNAEELMQENNESASLFLNSNANTSGTFLSFYTNSHYLTIHACLSRKYAWLKMLNCGASGFDVYKKTNSSVYHLTVVAAEEPHNIFSHQIHLGDPGEYIIYFPCYNYVNHLYIGLDSESILDSSKPFVNNALVFYGNSCTQGASASRSGNAYVNILQRERNCEIFNFSFTGACRAELSAAKRIVELMHNTPLDAFIIDCSKNSKSDEEFASRYPVFYQTIRSAFPRLPIILVGALATDKYDRVIREVFGSSKDEPVYYINLNKLFAGMPLDTFTVDGTHYTDIGMIMVAKAIGNFISRSNSLIL